MVVGSGGGVHSTSLALPFVAIKEGMDRSSEPGTALVGRIVSAIAIFFCVSVATRLVGIVLEK